MDWQEYEEEREKLRDALRGAQERLNELDRSFVEGKGVNALTGTYWRGADSDGYESLVHLLGPAEGSHVRPIGSGISIEILHDSKKGRPRLVNLDWRHDVWLYDNLGEQIDEETFWSTFNEVITDYEERYRHGGETEPETEEGDGEEGQDISTDDGS
jgi:hypothetical protein